MDEVEKIRGKLMKKEKKKKNKILSLLEFLLIIAALFLGFLIYAREDENGSFLNQYFHVNVSFKSFNDDLEMAIGRMLSDFNIFSLKEDTSVETVDKIYSYQQEEGNYFITDDHQIQMLKDGQILKLTKNQNYFDITLRYQGSILACYYEVFSPLVKEGDFLSAGDIFGSYENHFKALFTKDGEQLSYEEVLLS